MSEWISVDDETPPPGTYIVCSKHYVREATLWDNGKWIYEEAYDPHYDIVPTHWMEKPGRPEANDE